MMMRTCLLWIAILLAVVTLAGTALSVFGPERIALTEADLQERVNRALPRQFRNVTVERGTVSVAEGRVTVRVETRAAALGKSIATAAVARGVPQYNAERGEVFFDADDVKIEDSGAGGIVKQLGIRIGGKLGEKLEQNMPRVEDAAAGLVAGSIKTWLASQPVYRFKDDIKGVVLKATLKDIAVEGDRLVIGLSLIRLGAAFFAWLAALTLAVVGVVWLWVAHGGAEEDDRLAARHERRA